MMLAQTLFSVLASNCSGGVGSSHQSPWLRGESPSLAALMALALAGTRKTISLQCDNRTLLNVRSIPSAVSASMLIAAQLQALDRQRAENVQISPFHSCSNAARKHGPRPYQSSSFHVQQAMICGGQLIKERVTVYVKP